MFTTLARAIRKVRGGVDVGGVGVGDATDRPPLARHYGILENATDATDPFDAATDPLDPALDAVLAGFHARARARGYVLPSYTTRDEFADAVARAMASLATPNAQPRTPDPPPMVAMSGAMSPDEAARSFLTYLRSEFEITTEKTFPSAEVSAAYLAWTQGQRRSTPHENATRAAMVFLPGVRKFQRDRTIKGERKRIWHWTIKASSFRGNKRAAA